MPQPDTKLHVRRDTYLSAVGNEQAHRFYVCLHLLRQCSSSPVIIMTPILAAGHLLRPRNQ